MSLSLFQMCSDSRAFVWAILNASPLDVVSFSRKNILKRMETIVQDLEGGNTSAADLGELDQALRVLATPQYNLYDQVKSKELEQ